MNGTCEHDEYSYGDYQRQYYWRCQEPATVTMRAIDPMEGEDDYHLCAECAGEFAETCDYVLVEV